MTEIQGRDLTTKYVVSWDVKDSLSEVNNREAFPDEQTEIDDPWWLGKGKASQGARVFTSSDSNDNDQLFGITLGDVGCDVAIEEQIESVVQDPDPATLNEGEWYYETTTYKYYIRVKLRGSYPFDLGLWLPPDVELNYVDVNELIDTGITSTQVLHRAKDRLLGDKDPWYYTARKSKSVAASCTLTYNENSRECLSVDSGKIAYNPAYLLSVDGELAVSINGGAARTYPFSADYYGNTGQLISPSTSLGAGMNVTVKGHSAAQSADFRLQATRNGVPLRPAETFRCNATEGNGSYAEVGPSNIKLHAEVPAVSSWGDGVYQENDFSTNSVTVALNYSFAEPRRTITLSPETVTIDGQLLQDPEFVYGTEWDGTYTDYNPNYVPRLYNAANDYKNTFSGYYSVGTRHNSHTGLNYMLQGAIYPGASSYTPITGSVISAPNLPHRESSIGSNPYDTHWAVDDTPPYDVIKITEACRAANKLPQGHVYAYIEDPADDGPPEGVASVSCQASKTLYSGSKSVPADAWTSVGAITPSGATKLRVAWSNTDSTAVLRVSHTSNPGIYWQLAPGQTDINLLTPRLAGVDPLHYCGDTPPAWLSLSGFTLYAWTDKGTATVTSVQFIDRSVAVLPITPAGTCTGELWQFVDGLFRGKVSKEYKSISESNGDLFTVTPSIPTGTGTKYNQTDLTNTGLANAKVSAGSSIQARYIANSPAAVVYSNEFFGKNYLTIPVAGVFGQRVSGLCARSAAGTFEAISLSITENSRAVQSPGGIFNSPYIGSKAATATAATPYDSAMTSAAETDNTYRGVYLFRVDNESLVVTPPAPPPAPTTPTAPAASDTISTPSVPALPPDLPEPYIPAPEVSKLVYVPDDTLYRRTLTALCYPEAALRSDIRNYKNNAAPSTFKNESESYVWVADYAVPDRSETVVKVFDRRLRRAGSEWDFFTTSDAVWMPATYANPNIQNCPNKFVYMRNIDVAAATAPCLGENTEVCHINNIHPDSPVWYRVPADYRKDLPLQLHWIQVDNSDVIFGETNTTINVPYGTEVGGLEVRYRSIPLHESCKTATADINGFVVPIHLISYKNRLDELAQLYSLKREDDESNTSLSSRLRGHGIIMSLDGRRTPIFTLANALNLVILTTWSTNGTGDQTLDLSEYGDITDVWIPSLDEIEYITETLVPDKTYAQNDNGNTTVTTIPGSFALSGKRTIESGYNIYVDGQLIDESQTSVDNGIVTLKDTSVNTARIRYSARNYTVNRDSNGRVQSISSVPGNTPADDLLVVCMRTLKVWRPDTSTVNPNELIELKTSAAQTAPINLGSARWSDVAVWFDDKEPAPAVTYTPVGLDGNTGIK